MTPLRTTASPLLVLAALLSIAAALVISSPVVDSASRSLGRFGSSGSQLHKLRVVGGRLGGKGPGGGKKSPRFGRVCGSSSSDRAVSVKVYSGAGVRWVALRMPQKHITHCFVSG